MVLECVMLVLDNSSHSINGDYHPTRFQAQADAVHVIFNQKCNSNPENEVGLMLMAGKSPEVLVTPTQDEGKLIAALHECHQGGEIDLITAISVAQLALKHRQNKNQRQRIIVFIGSPLETNSAALVKLGKKMKKNNIALDLISFGSSSAALLAPLSAPSSSTAEPVAVETNETKLTALLEAVNSSENSHLLCVETGSHLLSEKISSSPILRDGDADDESGGGGGGEDGFGVDPNLDPELAMALRMSLEEESARQSAAASVPKLEAVPESISNPSAFETPIKTEVKMETEEEVDLKAALALSKGDDVEMTEEDDEEEEMRKAIAMSMKEEE